MELLVTPRPGLLDPQGKAIHHALSALGYESVQEVRVGKAIYLEVNANSADEACEQAREMCRKLLANPVTEDFRITVTQTHKAHTNAKTTETSSAESADAALRLTPTTATP